MSATVKVQARKDYIKNDGTTPLYLILTIDRKVKRIPLNFAVEASKWDWVKQQPKGNYQNQLQLNKLISDTIDKANSILLRMQDNDTPITIDQFCHRFLSNSNNSFYIFAEEYIAQKKASFSTEYIKLLSTEISKMKKFRSEITFRELDTRFLNEYDYYMRAVLKNKPNTVHKSFKTLRALINQAMMQDESLFKNNPFTKFKIKTAPTSREYLSFEEVGMLHDMLDSFPEKVINVMSYFLFSCYTGLRFSDIKELRFSNIRLSVKENYLELIMQKTKDSIKVPLIKKAILLLPENNGQTHVFNVLSGQKSNDYLKIGLALAGINRELSFHCGRHTFATIALNLDPPIPIAILQKLMGHRKIQTTQIYGKIMDKSLFREMGKMERK
jgi:integrase